MIGEIIYLITSIVVGIALMIRWGLFNRLMLEFWGQRILNELSCLKLSAPNLTSTFDGNSSHSL
jgi:hypothetical protein